MGDHFVKPFFSKSLLYSCLQYPEFHICTLKVRVIFVFLVFLVLFSFGEGHFETANVAVTSPIQCSTLPFTSVI